MKIAKVVLGNLAGLLWGNWILFVLLGLGVFYTIIMGRTRFRLIPRIIKELCPKKEKTEGIRDHKGTVSSIRTLYMAIASCVESEGIASVATALIEGESSALFWMWATAFLGMATEYVEIVLGLVFHQKGADGSHYGGPIYYIEKGLHTRLLGVATAVFLLSQDTGGTLIQPNTISDVTFQVFEVPKAITGVLIVAVMVFIIGGGPKRLAGVTQRIVSVMASLHIVGGIAVVLTNLDSILPMFRSILRDACSMKTGMGAAAGLTMKEAVCFGMAGGLYSSEAGEGSAAIIHLAAQVDCLTKQGFYGVMEVFVNTMVICSTTGFSILTSRVPLRSASTASLVIEAPGIVTPLFKYVVSVSLILFASTSIMSQWYFGHASLMYTKSLKGDCLYYILFPVSILLESLSTAGTVWSVQDCMLGLLITSNALALLKLSPVIMRMTREFFRENQQGVKKL